MKSLRNFAGRKSLQSLEKKAKFSNKAQTQQSSMITVSCKARPPPPIPPISLCFSGKYVVSYRNHWGIRRVVHSPHAGNFARFKLY